MLLTAPLIHAARLAAHEGEVRVCDVRWYLDGRSGRDAYRAGHLPGAVWVDLDATLAGPPSPEAGRHPLPAPSVFAAGLGAAGVGDGTPVVAYDDLGGMVAGRLVWLLRAIGHEAALLDGGLQAWPGALETGEVAVAPERFTPRPWPERLLADADEVAGAAAASGHAVVLDARAAERYRGEVEPVDPRAGHIPGARNAPFADNLGADGQFLHHSALRQRFESLGVGEDTDVIVYCGSGVSACHDLLALEWAGYAQGQVRLYPGSWSQWSADATRPANIGDEP
ncbi:MAG: sulfurtransferase [Acidimicrobiia bacterium]|nr:sulfurtransferase [Acidimicrobiia bacterium]